MSILGRAKVTVGIVVAAAMVATSMVGDIAVAVSATIKNPEANILDNGAVLSKTAKPAEGEINAWDVTMRIESPEVMTTSDTVVVIDVSGSMEKDNRMARAKEAAKALTAELLSDGNVANRVALLSFANRTKVESDFTTDYDAVATKIDNLKASGGTFTQSAIHKAAELLEDSTADIENIIVLSDGKPTYNYAMYEPDLYSVDGGPGMYTVNKEKQTSTDVPMSAFDYDSPEIGAGNSIWKEYKTEYDLTVKNYYHYFYNSGNCAIAEAGYYKAKGKGGVYTVALGEGDSELFTEILEQIASPGKAYTATVEDVKEIFEQIAGRITAAVNTEQVRDELNDGLRIANDSGTGIANARSLEWKPEFVYDAETNKYVAEITERVEADEGILESMDSEGFAPTSKTTTLVYGGGKTAEFPTPMVKPVVINITKSLLGQVCTECEFGVELLHESGAKQQVNVGADKTVTIVRRMREGGYSVREYNTTNNTVGLEEYKKEYTVENFVVDYRRVGAIDIGITNTYGAIAKGGRGGEGVVATGNLAAPEAGEGGQSADGKRVFSKIFDIFAIIVAVAATIGAAGALVRLNRK